MTKKEAREELAILYEFLCDDIAMQAGGQTEAEKKVEQLERYLREK